MKTTFRWLRVMGLCTILPIKVWSKVCPGGYRCTDPRECCAQGCCLFVPSSAYNPPTAKANDIFSYDFPVKVYLWVVVLTVAATAAATWCWRWRGEWRRGCGWCEGLRGLRGLRGAHPASEADSAGSCYYPPQYSRCGSLCRSSAQPQPPPYNEVTSKPDLYPMVIYLGADKGDGDIMVQYFKNYIVRPPGSLSAASTADSISSSYICNTANEANTIVPPPYSCAGSVEWSCLPAASVQRQALLRSISSVTCQEYGNATPRRTLQHSTSGHINATDSVINSESIDDIQDCENSEPIAQTSTGNTHCHAKHLNQSTHAHPSASNSKMYKVVSTLPPSPRIYSHNRDNSNTSNRQYFNIWEYSSNNQKVNDDDSYNISGNHLPKVLSPRLQMNKYVSESNELLDSIEQSHKNIYIEYVNRNASRGLQYNANSNYVTQSSNDGKTTNNQTENNYPYVNDEYERETPTSHPNSLEENQFCTYFSCSLPEAVTNDNISGDYSISTKHLNNFGSKEDISRYSVNHSITGSEISSLANFGTPDSPPQATSPTSEMKVLLDQIQQLPNQSNIRDECAEGNEESYFTSDVTKTKRYFSKSRKNSLYMPLNLVPNSKSFHPGKISPTANMYFKRNFTRKGWLSRSAPTTPCGSGLVPNILTMPQINPTTSSGRASRLSKNSHTTQADDSPLLTEQDVSGDEMEQ